MPTWLFIALILIWGMWVTQALLSVIQTRRMRNRVDRDPSERTKAYRPRATIVLPVKGVDLELEHCLAALCTQDYPD